MSNTIPGFIKTTTQYRDKLLTSLANLIIRILMMIIFTVVVLNKVHIAFSNYFISSLSFLLDFLC